MKHSFSLLFAFLLLLGVATSLRAAIDLPASSGTPGKSPVAAERSAYVPVTWHVRTTSGKKVISGEGRFMLGDEQIGKVSLNLARAVNAGATVMFTEGVQIPHELILQVLNRGAREFSYQRSFSDDSKASPANLSVQILILGGQAAGQRATQQTLNFNDDSSLRVVAQNQFVSAWSMVNLAGGGRVEAIWEIAEPGDGNAPVFHAFRQVHRIAMEGEPVRFISPPLPNKTDGQYWVRLRLTKPVPDFDPPQLRYIVTHSGAIPPVKVHPLSPGKGAELEEHTAFSWTHVEGAEAHLLMLNERRAEFIGGLPILGLPPDPEPSELAQIVLESPSAAMDVPGNIYKTELSARVRDRLKPGTAYLWRVLSLGRGGAVLGESPWREVRVPLGVP